ncbi:hypothetical protein CPB84DRAFT_1752405, partial [Gymnopilus junonius]
KPTDEDFVEWTKNVDKNVLHLLCTTFDPSQPIRSITPVGLSRLSIGVQEDASPSPSPSEDPSGPSDIVKTLFMQEFSISESVMARKWRGLRFAWTKYLACKKTLHAAKNLVDSGSWPVSLPHYSEHLIVELFIGKTTWYANYAPLFDKVNENHPEMAEWLELIDASQEDDKRVWGFLKQAYSFLELSDWIKCREKEKQQEKEERERKEKEKEKKRDGRDKISSRRQRPF